MEKEWPKLNPPPIVEAVFCVDFAGLPALTKKSAAALMQNVDSRYAESVDLVSQSLTFDMSSADKEVRPEVSWRGMRFLSGKSDVVVLSNMSAQIVRLAYSRLPPYMSWASFIGTARSILEKFIAGVRVDPVVKRLGVRYVNHLPVTDKSIPLADVISCVPSDPKGITGIVSRDFFYRDTSHYDEYDLDATLVRSAGRNGAGESVIVVDADVFSCPDVEVSKVKWDSLLERTHNLKNALFFGTVAEKSYKGLVK